MESSGNTFQIILGIVVCVLSIAGMWKVFTKANVPGWHSIIPFLNVYDICKISLAENVGLFTVLSILIPVVLIYPYVNLAKAFGKGTGFGVLMFFFSFIMMPILGFGDAQYSNPQ